MTQNDTKYKFCVYYLHTTPRPSHLDTLAFDCNAQTREHNFRRHIRIVYNSRLWLYTQLNINKHSITVTTMKNTML